MGAASSHPEPTHIELSNSWIPKGSSTHVWNGPAYRCAWVTSSGQRHMAAFFIWRFVQTGPAA